jgi:hypothetical protein
MLRELRNAQKRLCRSVNLAPRPASLVQTGEREIC